MGSVLMESGRRFWFMVVVHFITSCQKNESILEIAVLDFGSTDAFNAFGEKHFMLMLDACHL